MKLPVYLDNNATTPLDPRVLAAIIPVLETHFGNPASKTHSYGWYAEELVQIAREEVAALIGAKPEEIIFTSGATESDNLAIKGVLRARRVQSESASLHALSQKTEHKAVLDPLQKMEREGITVQLLDIAADGIIAPASVAAALRADTVLVSVMLANNEIGVIQDIRSLTSLTKERNIVFHCDAAQGLGKIEIDVTQLGVDLLSLSAHKVYGPKGVGALWVRSGKPKVLLEPLLDGGGHERGLRSGTLNVAGIVGFGKACALLKTEMTEEIRRISELTTYFLNQLQSKISGIEINGSPTKRIPGNLNLSLQGVDNTKLIAEVNSKLALSISSACTSGSTSPSYVLRALGLTDEKARSSVRIGIGRFTTEEEVLFAVEVLSQAAIKLKKNIA